MDKHNAYAKLNVTQTALLAVLRHPDTDTDRERERETDTYSGAQLERDRISERNRLVGRNRIVILMMGPAAIALQHRLRDVPSVFTLVFIPRIPSVPYA